MQTHLTAKTPNSRRSATVLGLLSLILGFALSQATQSRAVFGGESGAGSLHSNPAAVEIENILSGVVIDAATGSEGLSGRARAAEVFLAHSVTRRSAREFLRSVGVSRDDEYALMANGRRLGEEFGLRQFSREQIETAFVRTSGTVGVVECAGDRATCGNARWLEMRGEMAEDSAAAVAACGNSGWFTPICLAAEVAHRLKEASAV